ncbi:MAG TPA: hypothetical protein VKS82_02280 [Streptosporangiaceae bacterium]|nr:hypothetical protein [Streptosporangiaceae bacterium]
MIKLGVLAALDQRIAVRYQMPGMTPEETSTYITHHLHLAGRTSTLFTDDALASSTTPAAANPAPSTTSPWPPSSPPAPPARNSSTNPPPAPPSPKSSRQNEHPTDTVNTNPRPAPPGGVHLHPGMYERLPILGMDGAFGCRRNVLRVPAGVTLCPNAMVDLHVRKLAVACG